MSEDNNKSDKQTERSENEKVYRWHAVSRGYRHEERPAVREPMAGKTSEEVILDKPQEVFASEVLEAVDFSGKNKDDGVFNGASLIGANFSRASLKNTDFSGADLTGADLSGADLTGANLSGAILKNVNFTGACLNGVKLAEADIEGAILLDIKIDEMGLEDLQALIEYLAKYFPHKLNLAKMNLTLLDLKKIDLHGLNLRGVDFTGVDFTGVNIIGLNLSECTITPQQIMQAMGRVPSREELAKLLAPRKKDGKKQDWTIDWQEFFLNDKEIGVWDTTKDAGISIDKIVKAGRQVFRKEPAKPKIKDEQIIENVRSDKEAREKEHNEKVREIIEKNKQAVLEARKERQKELENSSRQEESKSKEIDLTLVHSRGGIER